MKILTHSRICYISNSLLVVESHASIPPIIFIVFVYFRRDILSTLYFTCIFDFLKVVGNDHFLFNLFKIKFLPLHLVALYPVHLDARNFLTDFDFSDTWIRFNVSSPLFPEQLVFHFSQLWLIGLTKFLEYLRFSTRSFIPDTSAVDLLSCLFLSFLWRSSFFRQLVFSYIHFSGFLGFVQQFIFHLVLL